MGDLVTEAPRSGAHGVISLDRWGAQRPRTQIEPGYCIAIGGAATAGRTVDSAWPRLLEGATGRMVLNLGLSHAGVDAMLKDGEIMRLASGAALRLVELPDATALSNPFYAVHPRRNDRFLRAELLLTRLYPEVDFTEFSFTRHLILALHELGAERFEVLRLGLAQVWLERMELLLDRLDGPSVLIWWGNRPALPPGAEEALAPGAPLLVDREMILKIRAAAQGLVEVIREEAQSLDAKPVMGERWTLPGGAAHQAVSEALSPWVRLQQA